MMATDKAGREAPRRTVWRRLLAVLTTLAVALGVAPGTAFAAEPDLTVYLTFEGYNLGQGYYVQPRKLTLPAGATAAQAAMTALAGTDHQISPSGQSPTSSGFYINGISGFDTGKVKVPSYITRQPDFEQTATNGDEYLGAGDYNSMSGWFYTVDNVAGEVSAGAYPLENGDVVRWQFTLYGYGCDLGLDSACWGGDPYFTMVDKSDLIRAIVNADPEKASAAALSAARAVAVDPTATRDEVAAATTALTEGEPEPEPKPEPEPGQAWIEVTTTAQGQLVTKLQEVLVNDHGQAAGSYDYSVVKKLRIAGPMNSADFTALRNTAYAATRIEELDLSEAVTTAMYALNGMTALTDVTLPSVTSLTTSNLFKDDAALKTVTVAAKTTSFGSTSTFSGCTALQRITFLNTTAPTTFNASTFTGSNNADADARVVTAAVPDKTSGGYQLASFRQYFAETVDLGENPPASAEEFAALQAVIDEAGETTRIDAYSDAKWAALQDSIAAAQHTRDNSVATSGAVADARIALQSAMDKLLGLSFKVTKGATIGLYQKGSLHFAAFSQLALTKVAELSDDGYDVYVPTTTVGNGTYNVSAYLHGRTDKVVRIISVSAATADAGYTLDLTPVSERQDTPLLIPGFGAGDVRGLYTNLDDTGVVRLEVGQTFDLDTFRTVQGQNDQVGNYFIEPDYSFEVAGGSITAEQTGSEGRRRLAITATEPGVSVIKIGYGPLKYIASNGTAYDFNGIDEQNTGLVVVDVGGTAAGFDSGITARNDLDTYYFDSTIGYREFSFTPAEGAAVRVHDPLNVSDWGTGWTTYQPAGDGSFTIRLAGGRNIVELTRDGVVQYRVVRAKGIDITIANATDPGSPFEAGDTAQLTLAGVEGGVEKLAGIYNPGFGSLPKLSYSDGTTSITSNNGGQYTSVTTIYTLNYTVSGDEEATLNGHLTIGGMGAEFFYHREIPVTGKPANLSAVAMGPYQVGSLPPVYVYADQVSTRPEVVATPVDFTVLHDALDQADGLTAGDYTAASWAAVQEAVDRAQVVAADSDAGQSAVDAVAADVTTAIAGLLRKGAAPAAPAVSATVAKARQTAAAWMAAQLADNKNVLPYGSSTDWGLTIDSLFALAGAKVGRDQIGATANAVYRSGEAYIGAPGQLASQWPYIAKTALALQVAGLDPTAFPVGGGTRDLIADLRASLRSDGKWTNSADAFKTSLGILALARTELGVPASAVTAFEAMACRDAGNGDYGSFGYLTGCGGADVDTTAMAVQALLAAGVSAGDPSVANAVAWLGTKQADDGSFPSPWSAGNTNSGGLAGQALFAVGNPAAASRSASFVQRLQLGCSTLVAEKITDPEVAASLKAANGAIAYNADGWSDGMEYGLDSANIDQWRRATAQAILGLGAPSLGFVSAAGASAAVPAVTCPSVLSVSVSPASVVQGGSVAFNGTGFVPGERVTVSLAPASTAVGTFTANGSGAVKATFAVPVAFRTGTHTVRFTGQVSGGASRTFTVTAKPGVPTKRIAFTAKFTGTMKVGKTLKAGPAPTGVTFSYQWLRDGKKVVGKKASYRLVAADAGHKLQLKITATKPGAAKTVKTTAAKTVAKLTPAVTSKLSKSTVKRTARAVVTVRISVKGLRPAGKVQVRYGSRSLRAAVKKGKATVKLPKLRKGTYKITVRYLGSTELKAKTAKTRTLKVK